MDPRQPCHIAALIERVPGSRNPSHRVSITLALFEATLKTITGVLHGALDESSAPEAGVGLSSLGTAGTWATYLRHLVKTPTVRARRDLTESLTNWLADESLPWLGEAMEAMKTVLALVQASAASPRHPTVCDLLDAAVAVRNAQAHGGVLSSTTLREISKLCRPVALKLLAEWPCRDWTWAVSSDHTWWSLQADVASQITPNPSWPAHLQDGVYVWSGDESPLRCSDLLLGDADPPRIFCLNSRVNAHGHAQYLEYASGTSRRGQVTPPPAHIPEWLKPAAPAPLVRMVGRASVVTKLTDLLVRARVVTVVGPAGLGKTTVAAETVRALPPEYRDHLLWCRCDLWPKGRDRLERAVLPALRHALSSRTKLLVLDSLEVAIDSEAGPSITDAIAAFCAENLDLRVLATSLIPLNVPGEQQYPLQPLESVPLDDIVPMEDLTTYPAVQLLVDRVRDVLPDYRIGPDDVEPLCMIARELGGHSLALELTGPPVAWRGAKAVARDLAADRFPVERDQGPERHRSVAAAIDYSLAALSPKDRQILTVICALAPASWSLLQGVASDLGIDIATLEASLHSLELRRLASRMHHLVPSPHSLIQRQFRATPAALHELVEAQRSAIIVMAGWYQQEAPTAHLCPCAVCALLDEAIAERYVTSPESLIVPVPIELLRLGLNWTRGKVATGDLEASSSDEETDGANVLFGLLHATGATVEAVALDVRLQAVTWWLDDPFREDGWLARAIEVADDLHTVGDDAQALELLERCVVGAYNCFGSSAEVDNNDLFERGRDVFVRQMRWSDGECDRGARSRAWLRCLRWYLDCGETEPADRQQHLRKARAVARRAEIWAERVDDPAGRAEAIISRVIIDYHLRPGFEHIVPAVTQLRWVDSLRRNDPASWQWLSDVLTLLLQRCLGHLETGLTGHWANCVEAAEQCLGQEHWTGAAEWIGYAGRCGFLESEKAEYETRVARIRTEIETHLGRGATTVAISQAGTASPDTILRDLGYWLPGDVGYADLAR